MNNLQSPAFPNPQNPHSNPGLSKLEYAAIVIAQGCMANSNIANNNDEYIARMSVSIAAAVLEEANK